MEREREGGGEGEKEGGGGEKKALFVVTGCPSQNHAQGPGQAQMRCRGISHTETRTDVTDVCKEGIHHGALSLILLKPKSIESEWYIHDMWHKQLLRVSLFS